MKRDFIYGALTCAGLVGIFLLATGPGAANQSHAEIIALHAVCEDSVRRLMDGEELDLAKVEAQCVAWTAADQAHTEAFHVRRE